MSNERVVCTFGSIQVKSRQEKILSKESARQSAQMILFMFGIKMNCVFTKDMDHCRRQRRQR